ncbi:histidine kinase, partial [Streptomyces sp. Tu102]|uniref:histidine kinase n=1 Tax=Streptomyces sp. Tu102 TaxID=2838019 RepID=UPI00202A0628
TIEMLLDKDPEKARQLVAQARRSSADALSELRDLVRVHLRRPGAVVLPEIAVRLEGAEHLHARRLLP